MISSLPPIGWSLVVGGRGSISLIFVYLQFEFLFLIFDIWYHFLFLFPLSFLLIATDPIDKGCHGGFLDLSHWSVGPWVRFILIFWFVSLFGLFLHMWTIIFHAVIWIQILYFGPSWYFQFILIFSLSVMVWMASARYNLASFLISLYSRLKDPLTLLWNAPRFLRDHGVPLESCVPYNKSQNEAPECPALCKDGSDIKLWHPVRGHKGM